MKRSHLLNRRTVLGGLGATLSLPFFESLGGKTLAAEKKGKDPSRFACFYIPGAISQYTWFPKDTGAKYSLAPTHKPLEHHRDNFSVLTGLSHIEGRISGHTHPYSWLTGHNINLVPGTLTNTISVDQVAAKHLGPTYLNSLVLSWANGVGTTTLSRNSLGVDIPATADYRRVFENLFPPADRGEIKKAQERLALNRSILDTATGDIKDVKRKLGRIDQERLDQYLHSVRDVEKRLIQKEAILEDGRPKFDQSKVRLEREAKNSMREHIELMTDLITLAFQTDMTRVATFMLGREVSGRAYPEIGVPDAHHPVSHHQYDPEKLEKLSKINTFHLTQFAYFVDTLAQTADGDRTLLDNAMLLYGSGISDSNVHMHDDLPIVLVGGGGGTLQGGRHLRYPKNTPLTNLYLSLLDRMHVPVESVGDSTGRVEHLSGV